MNVRLLQIVFAIALLGLFLPPKWLTPIRDRAWWLISPLTSRLSQTAAASRIYWENLRILNQLVIRNEQLSQEKNQLTAELAQLQEIKKENIFLKQELQLTAAPSEQTKIIAPVIGRANFGARQYLVIGKGKNHHLQKGQAVLSQGFIIGRLNRLDEKTAEVKLIFSPDNLLAVVLEKNRANGLLKGGLTGLFIEDLPIDIPVEQGEMVITSSLGNVTPAGLPVGQVTKIQRGSSEIFQQLEITSPVDINKIDFVTIIQ